MTAVVDFTTQTADFETIIDFLRFGLTEANKGNIYFGHGTDNATDDIWFLIIRSLSLPFEIKHELLHGKLTPNEKKLLASNLALRIQEHIPVPYIVNEAYFCGLPFYVDDRVLIPRSPIGELISQQFHPWIDEDKVHRILDLCTGSGCIAIACNEAFPHALVDATDLSEKALEVAEINRKRHGLDDSLNLILSNCWENVPKQRYDIIVSNPPYVSSEDMAHLPKEYLHEPTMALQAANNGLAIVDEILAHAHEYLTEHGILIVEVGLSDEALAAAYPDIDFIWLDFEKGGEGVFMLHYQQLKQHFG